MDVCFDWGNSVRLQWKEVGPILQMVSERQDYASDKGKGAAITIYVYW